MRKERSFVITKMVTVKEDTMPNKLVKPIAPDRSKIAMHEDDEVKYWTKHLHVTREELQRAVDKVGSSAASVRKELGNQRKV